MSHPRPVPLLPQGAHNTISCSPDVAQAGFMPVIRI